LRPRACIKYADGKVPNDVPINIIVMGTVTKVRLSPNIAIETRAAEINVSVLPLLNSAWHMAKTITFFILRFSSDADIIAYFIHIGLR
jgi:hypothetical protein